jgi:hypothetical protein
MTNVPGSERPDDWEEEPDDGMGSWRDEVYWAQQGHRKLLIDALRATNL